MQKSQIRKKILKIRENNSNKNLKITFNQLYKIIKKINKFKKKIVGGYYPVNYEFNDLYFLKELKKRKIRISLPSISKNFKMNFFECTLKEPLAINRYGIPEPINGKIVYPDILLIPLVSFDKNLNRLGYGGGYYDRVIKSLKNKKKITTIGLAFDFQEFNLIPISQYDQKLDYILTNKKILQ